MTYGMIVQMPVTVAFGTDEEFDLRVRLESDLTAALDAAGVGECVGAEINTSDLKIVLDAISDPLEALAIVKTVLAKSGLLGRAVIVLESRSDLDPDDADLQILWPANHSGKYPVA